MTTEYSLDQIVESDYRLTKGSFFVLAQKPS